MRKLVFVVVVLAAIAAGAWYFTRGGGAGNVGSVLADGDAPLAFVPADTPYVFANLEAMPQATIDAFLQQSEPALKAWTGQFDRLDAKLASDQTPGANWVRALRAEFKDKSVTQAFAAMGLELRSHSAIYGIGLVPVARMTLSDPAAFRAFVARVEAGAGEKLATGLIDDVDYWQFTRDGAPVRGVMAVHGRQVVLTVAPTGDDASLRTLLGLERPANSLRDGAPLRAINAKYGYTPYATGYVDTTRLVALAVAPPTPLETAFLAALEVEKPAIDPVCQSEYAALAVAAPRLTVGYTTLEPKASHAVTRLELRSDLAQDLMTLRAPMPGLAAAETSMMNFGLSLKLAELPKLVNKWAGAVASAPWQCASLASLNDAFAQGRTQASNPAVFAAAPVFTGLHAMLTRFEMAGAGATPDGAGKLIVGSPNPAALVGMARGFVPALAQFELKPDGEVHALPAVEGLPPNLPAHVAMTDTLLGLAVGSGEEATLAQSMATDPAQQPLLVIGYTGAAFTRFAEQMLQSTAAMQDAEQRAESEASLAMMREMYGLIGRIEMRVEFDADGVAVHQSATMN